MVQLSTLTHPLSLYNFLFIEMAIASSSTLRLSQCPPPLLRP